MQNQTKVIVGVLVVVALGVGYAFQSGQLPLQGSLGRVPNKAVSGQKYSEGKSGNTQKGSIPVVPLTSGRQAPVPAPATPPSAPQPPLPVVMIDKPSEPYQWVVAGQTYELKARAVRNNSAPATNYFSMVFYVNRPGPGGELVTELPGSCSAGETEPCNNFSASWNVPSDLSKESGYSVKACAKVSGSESCSQFYSGHQTGHFSVVGPQAIHFTNPDTDWAGLPSDQAVTVQFETANPGHIAPVVINIGPIQNFEAEDSIAAASRVFFLAEHDEDIYDASGNATYKKWKRSFPRREPGIYVLKICLPRWNEEELAQNSSRRPTDCGNVTADRIYERVAP